MSSFNNDKILNILLNIFNDISTKENFNKGIENLKKLLNDNFSNENNILFIFQQIHNQLLNLKKDQKQYILTILPFLCDSNPEKLSHYLEKILSIFQSSICEESQNIFSLISKTFGDCVKIFLTNYNKNNDNNNVPNNNKIIELKPQLLLIYTQFKLFCLTNLKSTNKYNQICGALCLTSFIENCSYNYTNLENLKILWENIINQLDNKYFIPKLELLNCLISLIFASEKNFKSYASITLYKIIDFITDKDWLKRKLALNVVYTLIYYCSEEIIPLKSFLNEFLISIKNDKNPEVEEVINQIIKMLNNVNNNVSIISDKDNNNNNNEQSLLSTKSIFSESNYNNSNKTVKKQNKIFVSKSLLNNNNNININKNNISVDKIKIFNLKNKTMNNSFNNNNSSKNVKNFKKINEQTLKNKKKERCLSSKTIRNNSYKNYSSNKNTPTSSKRDLNSNTKILRNNKEKKPINNYNFNTNYNKNNYKKIRMKNKSKSMSELIKINKIPSLEELKKEKSKLSLNSNENFYNNNLNNNYKTEKTNENEQINNEINNNNEIINNNNNEIEILKTEIKNLKKEIEILKDNNNKLKEIKENINNNDFNNAFKIAIELNSIKDIYYIIKKYQFKNNNDILIQNKILCDICLVLSNDLLEPENFKLICFFIIKNIIEKKINFNQNNNKIIYNAFNEIYKKRKELCLNQNDINNILNICNYFNNIE